MGVIEVRQSSGISLIPHKTVKRTYYAIVQSESALQSVRQALAFYRELERVTGDYVVQQVALKADDLE